MARGDTTDILEHLATCGSYDKHHVLRRTPFLTFAHHFLEEPFAVFILRELEIEASLVARECKHDDPLALVLEERRHRVLAHVGSYGESVDIVFFKEGTRVHL